MLGEKYKKYRLDREMFVKTGKMKLSGHLYVLRVLPVRLVSGQQDIRRYGEASVHQYLLHPLRQRLEALLHELLQPPATVSGPGLKLLFGPDRPAFAQLPHTHLLHHGQNVAQAVLEGASDSQHAGLRGEAEKLRFVQF